MKLSWAVYAVIIDGQRIPDWIPETFRRMLVAAREARKECFAPALARAKSTSEHQSITLSKIGDCIV